jgi:hypothetical protein
VLPVQPTLCFVASVPAASRAVLLDDVSGDTAAVADGDAAVFGPGPDIAATPAARGAAAQPLRLPTPGLAGMLDKRCQFGAERSSVLGAQVDLIVRAIHPEPHCLIGRATIEVILQRDGYSLSHLNLP